MKYSKNNAIGDAGEHYFAFSVATILGWPCRLLDVDIGIDAQVEILDSKEQSTGQFLAIQIKTTTDPTLDSKYIPLTHVKYWKTVESPVLVALVDIETKHVYLKYIDKGARLVPAKTGGDTCKIKFDKKNWLLSKSLVPKLRQLVFAQEIKLIKAGLSELKEEFEKVIRQTDYASHDNVVEDHDHYLDLMRDFRRLEAKLHKSKILVERIYESVGDCGYGVICEMFFTARRALVDFLYHYEFHYHDAEEIKSFENEYAETTTYLELRA